MTEPRKRKRSQKSIQTEQAILQHAKRIFSEVGFERATTKEIAQAAQVAEGTLFHHFANKMALLEGLTTHIYDRLQEEAEKICVNESDAAQRLRLLTHNHLQTTMSEWHILRISSAYGRYGDQAFGEVFYQLNKRYVRLFVDVLDELKRQLSIRNTTPTPLIRDTLFGSMEHFIIRNFGRKHPHDLEPFADQLLDLIIFGCGR